jgi:hypothetical protein
VARQLHESQEPKPELMLEVTMQSRLVLSLVTFLISSSIANSVAASPAGDYFPVQSVHFDTTVPDSETLGRPWHVTFMAPTVSTSLDVETAVTAAAAQDNQRPMAFEYSDAYNTRRKIHMIASYATIPLFVAQYMAGEKLFDDSNNSSAKSAHGALTIGIATLFAVNTVTGVWNLWEARKDPNGHTRRLVHGLMMLGADFGFAATGALAPDGDEDAKRSTHRTVAISSMGVAAASYVYMLVTR